MVKENVFEAINVIAEQQINNAGFDKTIQGQIVRCVDATIGAYDVKVPGDVYRAYSIVKGIEYAENSNVTILIPGGNPNNEKIILGSTDKNSTAYVKPLEDSYVSNDYNIFDKITDIALCTYKSPQQVKLTQEDGYALKKHTVDSIQDSTDIYLTFDIQTKIPQEQSRGDYGLVLQLEFSVPTDEAEIETKEYIVNITKMIGDPYRFINKVSQRVRFSIDNLINFKGIKSITGFVKDFIPGLESEEYNNDIFITNIGLTGANKLTSDELNGTTLKIVSTTGFHFIKQNDSITVQAKMFSLGKEVNEKEQAIEYYWFKKKLTVTANSEQYSPYGKSGWKCLNPSLPLNTSDNNTVIKNKFKSGTNTITLKEADNKSPTNLYKCVVVQNGEQISKEFTLINDNAQYKIKVNFTNVSNPNILEQREDYLNVQFDNKQGFPSIECIIYKDGKPIDEYEEENCLWKCYDADGVEKKLEYQTIQDTKEQFLEDKDYLQRINDIAEQLKNGKYVDKSLVKNTETKRETAKECLDRLKLYKQNKKIINGEIVSIKKPQVVNLNTLYNLWIDQIEDFNTFNFVYKDDTNTLAQTTIVISNKQTSHKYHLVIQNGTQNFVYNVDGIKPSEIPLDLTYQLFDGNGVEVDKRKIYSQWRVPTIDTLLNISTDVDKNLIQEKLLLDTNNKYYKNINVLPFDIEQIYSFQKKNNDIQLMIDYNGYQLSATTNFTFVKQGGNGTNGTGAVFTLTAYDGNKKVIYPRFINGIKANFTKIVATFLKNNENVEISSVKWFKLAEENGKLSNSKFSFIENETSNELLSSNILKTNNNYQVIKAEVTVDGLKYYATLPILYTSLHSNDNELDFYLYDGTGYTEVTYAQDGTRPQYDSNSNFILKLISPIYGDISVAEKAEMKDENETKVTTTYSFSPDNIFIRKYENINPKNVFTLVPPNNYINEDTSIIPITFTATYDDGSENKRNETLIIPIHFMLNRYGHSALNDWDGDSIDIGGSSGDIVLAPQVGAGTKDNNNAFTGVLIGSVKNGYDTKLETGLFGYDRGARSIFLDAQTGKAVFGKDKKAQITIDPSKEEGIIEGGEYTPKGTELDNGAISPGQGMQINLTKPEILFGTGNFSVNKQGHLIAKGGGEIAGWKISDDTLTSEDGKVYLHSKNYSDNPYAIYSNETFSVTNDGKLYSVSGQIAGWKIEKQTLTKENDNTIVGMNSDPENPNYPSGIKPKTEKEPTGHLSKAFFAGANADKFYVTHDGFLKSTDGKIANWTITNNALYSKNKSSFTTNEAGAYIGEGGIALGSYDGTSNAFQVDNDGNLKARLGQIANWNISNNAFYTGDNEPYTSGNVPTGPNADKKLTEQLYFGKAGLALGKNFSVNPSGELYAISGNIGGIVLNSGGLHGNNFNISGSGTADFTNVKINGASLEGTLKNSGTLSGGSVSGAGISGGSFSPSTIKNADNGKQTMNDWAEWISEQTFERLRTKELQAGVVYAGTVQAGDFAFNNGIDSVGAEFQNISSMLFNAYINVNGTEYQVYYKG